MTAARSRPRRPPRRSTPASWLKVRGVCPAAGLQLLLEHFRSPQAVILKGLCLCLNHLMLLLEYIRSSQAKRQALSVPEAPDACAQKAVESGTAASSPRPSRSPYLTPSCFHRAPPDTGTCQLPHSFLDSCWPSPGAILR